MASNTSNVLGKVSPPLAKVWAVGTRQARQRKSRARSQKSLWGRQQACKGNGEAITRHAKARSQPSQAQVLCFAWRGAWQIAVTTGKSRAVAVRRQAVAASQPSCGNVAGCRGDGVLAAMSGAG